MRRAAASWAAAARRRATKQTSGWQSTHAAHDAAPGCRALATAARPPPPPPPPSWTRFLLFIPPAAAAYLCHWQVDRKAWKEAQLEGWARAVQADPLPLAALPPHSPELTRVTAAGVLAHDRSAFIGPRPRSAPGGATVSGFQVVTPLLDGPGGSVIALVARGWVPASWKEAPAAEPAGAVTLSAVVRRAEAPSRFVPPNNPAAGEWHWMDPDALAAAAGACGPVPLLEALAPDVAPPPVPRGGGAPPPMDVLGGRTGSLSTTAAAPGPSYPAPRRLADITAVAVTPADHRNYALTWGTLAVATAGLAVRAVRRR